jgi:hypothetical protein
VVQWFRTYLNLLGVSVSASASVPGRRESGEDDQCEFDHGFSTVEFVLDPNGTPLAPLKHRSDTIIERRLYESSLGSGACFSLFVVLRFFWGRVRVAVSYTAVGVAVKAERGTGERCRPAAGPLHK